MSGPGPSDTGRSDTAGIPFSGREVTSTGFDDDRGEADAALMAALASGDEEAWVAALAESRLLVPIVAAPTEVDTSGEHAVEKSTDMAVVTLTAPDGTKGLPVFTSLEALAAWDPAARPSPVKAAFAAQAAISEECDVLLLDMASEHRVVVRASMVWALAQQQAWVPAYRDTHVRSAIGQAVRVEEAVLAQECVDGGEGVLRLRLTLAPGLSQDEVRALATRVGERLAADGETRARIEALAFEFVAA
ncbi:SseB family protein [Dermacoccus nishinomiyaensis]|uniref:SseB family protein n=1 Tax=Dermacoccus nishinomiyaensis TaxID=1274 RepID=UPI00119FA12A|nr:SseB family protein [Dermacoccus nishinomiyaensis]